MAVNLINSSVSGNLTYFVTRVSNNVFSTGNMVNPGKERTNLSEANRVEEPDIRSWSTGSGALINTTGTLVFNAASGGGCLFDVTVSNSGPNTLWVGFNSSFPGVDGSGGFPIASGVQFSYYSDIGPIKKIWGVTSTGTAIMNAQGLFRNYTDAI